MLHRRYNAQYIGPRRGRTACQYRAWHRKGVGRYLPDDRGVGVRYNGAVAVKRNLAHDISDGHYIARM
eukprot:3940947-Rhodomonas_salina.2